jgi:glycosyltransferase involved in cell wall biosynthesis
MSQKTSRHAKYYDSNLVFLPAWNEEATVSQVVLEIKRIHPDFDVLVIDDGSNDLTGIRAKAAGAVVLRLPINLGVGGAVKCALRYGIENSYNHIFQIDADGQHDPKYIINLKAKLDAGSDLCIGTRFGIIDHYRIGRIRILTIKILSKIVKRIIGVKISDPTSGFRGFSRKAIEALYLDFPTEYLGDTIECLLLAHHAGLSISEISVGMKERQGGNPSAGLLRSFGYLVRAIFAISVSEIRHMISKH